MAPFNANNGGQQPPRASIDGANEYEHRCNENITYHIACSSITVSSASMYDTWRPLVLKGRPLRWQMAAAIPELEHLGTDKI